MLTNGGWQSMANLVEDQWPAVIKLKINVRQSIMFRQATIGQA